MFVIGVPSFVSLYTILWLLNGLAGGPGWPAAALIMKAVSYNDPVIVYIYITQVVLYNILWLLNCLAGGPGWPVAAHIMKAVSYNDPVIVYIYISHR